ncbi:MAG: RNA polymerase sigma factor [Pirellulales bacterium]|nr:RNA polymerase sigma factor [Pirellulales bacterium]
MQQLQQRLAAGDEAAFAELYDALALRLYRFLLSRLRSRDAADDVLQETFVRLAQGRAGLRQVRHLTAYLFGIARHEVERYVSSARHRRRYPFESFEAPPMAATTPPWENTDEVELALGQLPDLQREVVELKIFGELTFVEIAEALGTPQGTVATRYRTALSRMRAWLEQREDDRHPHAPRKLP